MSSLILLVLIPQLPFVCTDLFIVELLRLCPIYVYAFVSANFCNFVFMVEQIGAISFSFVFFFFFLVKKSVRCLFLVRFLFFY